MDLEPPVPERSDAEDKALRRHLAQLDTFGERVSYLRETLPARSGRRLSQPVVARFISDHTGRSYTPAWLWNIENGKRGKNPDKDIVRAFAACYRVDQDDLVPSDLPPELRRISDALDDIGKMTVNARRNPAGSGELSSADYAGLADILETVARDVRQRRQADDGGKSNL